MRPAPRPAPDQPRFRVSVALLAWLAAFVVANVGTLILLTLTGHENDSNAGFRAACNLADLGGRAPGSCDPTPLWVTAVLQIPLWLGLVGGAVVVSQRFGTGDLRRDYGLEVRRSDAVGIPIGVVAQLVFVPLVSVPVTWLFGRERLEEPARELTARAEGIGIALLIVLVVVCAPVIEELFFRGLVLRSFQAQYNDGLALIASSVLFGLAHFQLLQLPALVMFGLVSGYCAQRTGRLGMSIFAHAGFNAVSVLVLVLDR